MNKPSGPTIVLVGLVLILVAIYLEAGLTVGMLATGLVLVFAGLAVDIAEHDEMDHTPGESK